MSNVMTYVMTYILKSVTKMLFYWLVVAEAVILPLSVCNICNHDFH